MSKTIVFQATIENSEGRFDPLYSTIFITLKIFNPPPEDLDQILDYLKIHHGILKVTIEERQ